MARHTALFQFDVKVAVREVHDSRDQDVREERREDHHQHHGSQGACGILFHRQHRVLCVLLDRLWDASRGRRGWDITTVDHSRITKVTMMVMMMMMMMMVVLRREKRVGYYGG